MSHFFKNIIRGSSLRGIILLHKKEASSAVGMFQTRRNVLRFMDIYVASENTDIVTSIFYLDRCKNVSNIIISTDRFCT